MEAGSAEEIAPVTIVETQTTMDETMTATPDLIPECKDKQEASQMELDGKDSHSEQEASQAEPGEKETSPASPDELTGNEEEQAPNEPTPSVELISTQHLEQSSSDHVSLESSQVIPTEAVVEDASGNKREREEQDLDEAKRVKETHDYSTLMRFASFSREGECLFSYYDASLLDSKVLNVLAKVRMEEGSLVIPDSVVAYNTFVTWIKSNKEHLLGVKSNVEKDSSLDENAKEEQLELLGILITHSRFDDNHDIPINARISTVPLYTRYDE